jgi:hypothetical protein
MNLEYRITWQRKGKAKKAKIYQTRDGAKSFLAVLRTSHPDEPPEDMGNSASGVEQWERMTARFVVEPRLETREVGEWLPVPSA